MASYGSQPAYSMSTYAQPQQQVDVGQLMADMAELFPKLTPEYQSQAREAHQHVLQLQRQGMTNEAISLLEHMRNQMRQMVETSLTPGRVPAVPESPIPSSEEGGEREEGAMDSPAPAAVVSRTSIGHDPSPVHQPRRTGRSRRTNLPDGAVQPSSVYQQAGQSQPELSLDNGPFGTPPLGGGQPDFAAGSSTVPASAPALHKDPKDAESIKLLRRQVKELKMELARTKGPESAQDMEKRLRMQEMEQRYTSLENTVRDLRSLLSEQLSKTSHVVQQAEFQVKEQERIEKAKRPKNPFCRHGADDVCEFCESRKARYLGSEPSLAAGPPRSGQQQVNGEQGRYQDLLSEMQNTLLSYQQSLVDMLSERKEELKKKENDNNDELKEAQDRRKNIEEVERKKVADKTAAAKELEDEYNKAKKDYDKQWGKNADLSPRTLALASANEGRTAAEAAAKQQAEAQQKAKEQEEKAKSFERQARKAAGGGDKKSDNKSTKKNTSQKATASDKSKGAKGGKANADPSVESDSDDSDDSDVLARVMARGDGQDQDLAANVQMAELRRHQQAEIEKQQNTLNEQRQAIEEQKAELLKLQESLKAQLVSHNQQPQQPSIAAAGSSDGEDSEDEVEGERPPAVSQQQWAPAPPAPVAPGPPAKSPVYQTSMQSTGSWVPGRPDDRERYNQQQQQGGGGGGGVPVVSAVLVPPEKVVDGQQGGASSPSYAAVASGASAAPPPSQRYAPQGYQMPPNYYQPQQQAQGGYTIPQAQVPMPPPRNLRVPTPDLPQRQQQSAPQGYAQPQQVARPATVTTPSPPKFPKVPFVGARKTSTRTSSGDAGRQQQQQAPPPQASRPAAPPTPAAAPSPVASEPSRVPGLRRKLTGNLSAAKGWPGAETQGPTDSEFKWPQQQ